MTQQQSSLVLPLLKSGVMRRSVYKLNQDLPLSHQEVADLVGHVLKYTPSFFNVQSTRVLLLFGQDHQDLWEIVRETLRPLTGEAQWEATSKKTDGFRAAAGTAAFFEDMAAVRKLQAQFPLYKDSFDDWSDHGNAMNQFHLWQLLSAAGAGANLQHYNPIIDEKAKKRWNIPEAFRLRAQLVFGGISEPAGEKEHLPLEKRMRVYGAQEIPRKVG